LRLTDNEAVQIRIEASDLPGRSCSPSLDRPGGHSNIHAGVQRRNQPDELLDLVPGDAPSATWTLDCKATASSTGVDLTGPYIQGRPGGRFIYVSWGTLDEAHDFRCSVERSSSSTRFRPPFSKPLLSAVCLWAGSA
jgi:hypothetical protein